MSEQRNDLFGEIFQRYFTPAIGTCPPMEGALVERLLALTDDVHDRLAQTRRAAVAWADEERPNAGITSESFVVTQYGLMYAAGLSEPAHALYYLATPLALFDSLIDHIENAQRREDTVV